MHVLLLNESELRRCVAMDADSLSAVADGFTQLHKGKATVPPVVAILVPERHGEVDIKTAVIEGLDSFAVKIASGFPDNPASGLAANSGMMILLSTETGFLRAVLADNGYLTDVRTGLAGAIAAQHLAPRRPLTVGVVGSGVQARYQVYALRVVRDIRRLLVVSRDPQHAGQYAAEMAEALQVPVQVAADEESLVRESDVVVTTTTSREPHLRAEWLHPGQHITCMGADMDVKQELHSDCFKRADLVVCDRLEQCRVIGELRHAFAAGAVAESAVVQLGELTGGSHPGRSADDQITVCDLTGVGVQDTAIARLAYARAVVQGLGTVIETA